MAQMSGTDVTIPSHLLALAFCRARLKANCSSKAKLMLKHGDVLYSTLQCSKSTVSEFIACGALRKGARQTSPGSVFQTFFND